MREVGPGGHFLGAAHTRKSGLFRFLSQNNAAFEQWEADGRKDSAQVGAEKARDWLDKYEMPVIDSSVDAGLTDFMAEAQERPAKHRGGLG